VFISFNVLPNKQGWCVTHACARRTRPKAVIEPEIQVMFDVAEQLSSCVFPSKPTPDPMLRCFRGLAVVVWAESEELLRNEGPNLRWWSSHKVPTIFVVERFPRGWIAYAERLCLYQE
jgi:hypothetical protein